MKEPPFLDVDFRSTVAMTSSETRQVKRALQLASFGFCQLLKEGLLPSVDRPGLKQFQLSMLLCGDRKIQSLNGEHRKKDKVTDVLSFPAHESLRKPWKAMDLQGETVYLGDVAISCPQAHRQARQFDITFADEFTHLLVHGILHLLGFDHEASKREEQIMEKWEQRFLELIAGEKKRGPKAP